MLDVSVRIGVAAGRIAGFKRLLRDDTSMRRKANNMGSGINSNTPKGMNMSLAEMSRKPGGLVMGWCSSGSALLGEAMAAAGFAALTVDLQHGVQDFADALRVLQAVDGRGVPAMCRVPWNEPGIVMKALDAGFEGVICPMINDRADAQRLASFCHYPPHGRRSFGPHRAKIAFGGDYVEKAWERMVILPMVETEEGLQNVDEILSTPGISGVYVGPNDLALALGHPALATPCEPVQQAIMHILARTRSAGKICGIACSSAQMVADMLRAGFHIATLQNDLQLFLYGMNQQLAEVKERRLAEG
ncbi:HpcH/HpaI aldolase family protein [Candidimonas nitroreducens]|uniref:2,4-dihydroxyhept-2-ene-1,7-dioic acid aldolase n=1 Tax=Candidimonas nitroreducens TaxID=683354 RepID=A0A225MGP7_9BURK|nr:aldolase/citrate lyase family protein [Candidimonas nitroreducens]OWT60062.1 2,4-dihydroxyhept-2-ene-1,7-dioic acid aldolase [Candidimonas nitroreducens]